ncbi:MAG TPA: HAMP domain-containing methyl-accepting chemotaxis protein [Stellaceae bacterium]|nr:HAMP domain-containing methyl-accepting chemotaxis protein [Stellaceae bacterium]
MFAMANFKISTRIFGGFTLILALLTALGATGLWGLNGVSTQLGWFAHVSDNAVRLLELDVDMMSVRRAAITFVSSGSSTTLDQTNKLRESVQARFADLDRHFTTEARRQDLARLKTIYEAYTSQLDNVARLRATADRIRNEELVPVGPRMLGKLRDAIQAAMESGDMETAARLGIVQQQLMDARLSSVRFRAEPDRKDAEAGAALFAKAKQTLRELEASLRDPRIKAVVHETGEAAIKYSDAYDRNVAATLALRDTIAGPLVTYALEFNRAIEAAKVAQLKTLSTAQEVANAATSQSETISVGTAAVALAVGLLLAWVIGRGIVTPLRRMTDAMARLAGGDKTVAIPATKNKDEIGAMARAVLVFKENMIKADEMGAEQRAEQGRKEQRQQVVETQVGAFDRSVNAVLQMTESATTKLQNTAKSMLATAKETSRQSTVVAVASEQASTNVQTVASAAEELSSSITEISRQVAESARIAREAVDDAGRTNAQVQTLAEAAQKIGDVVKLINDIAARTNLLALNATIEAARAGEAGKGFAVVASEVKSLATQTAKATEDIAAQVKAIQSATGDSVQAIETITGTINRINEITTTVAAAVEEQGAATQEIARNVLQASVGTAEVSSNIAGVTEAAAETGSASTQVMEAAGDLAQQSETLRGEVSQFLAKIRAA